MRVASRIAALAGATAVGALTMTGPAAAAGWDAQGPKADDEATSTSARMCSTAVDGTQAMGLLLPVVTPRADRCINAPLLDHPAAH